MQCHLSDTEEDKTLATKEDKPVQQEGNILATTHGTLQVGKVGTPWSSALLNSN